MSEDHLKTVRRIFHFYSDMSAQYMKFYNEQEAFGLASPEFIEVILDEMKLNQGSLKTQAEKLMMAEITSDDERKVMSEYTDIMRGLVINRSVLMEALSNTLIRRDVGESIKALAQTPEEAERKGTFEIGSYEDESNANDMMLMKMREKQFSSGEIFEDVLSVQLTLNEEKVQKEYMDEIKGMISSISILKQALAKKKSLYASGIVQNCPKEQKNKIMGSNGEAEIKLSREKAEIGKLAGIIIVPADKLAGKKTSPHLRRATQPPAEIDHDVALANLSDTRRSTIHKLESHTE